MTQRDYLGDEVHMMQSDITTLRHENDLLKMKAERQDETITTLRSDLARMRAAYENKVVEATTLQTMLENVGLVISDGIQRYLRRRELKVQTDTIAREAETVTERVTRAEPPRHRMGVGYDKIQATRPVVEKNPEPGAEPAPVFLRRPTVTDHHLLPPIEARSDQDVLRELARGIDKRIEQ